MGDQIQLLVRAVSGGTGSSPIGNFLDAWQIQLQPYIEVASATNAAYEGSGGGTTNPLNGSAVRIGGTIPSGQVALITVSITGGTATLGSDYSLTPTFQSSSRLSSVTLSIPAGTYDGVSVGSNFPIPFSVSADSEMEPDETVNFQISDPVNVAVASVGACGTAAIGIGQFTILKDDEIPTSAPISVSGRIMDRYGNGLRGVTVELIGFSGVSRLVLTSSLRYFRFDGVPSCESFIIKPTSRRYSFDPVNRVVTTNDNVSGIFFYGLGTKYLIIG